MDHFSRTQGLRAPYHRKESRPPTFDLQGPGGPITLVSSSRTAFVDGVTLWLGFPPQAREDRLFVHDLDVQKNLTPLLRGSESLTLPNRTIVIDPGHGGENPGTRSVVHGSYEKVFTLDWALRLRPLLERQGWRVVLTRTNDVDVPLTNRVALADHENAALFISLHFNASPGRADQSGIETFCLTPAGMPSTLTRDYEDDQQKVFPNNAWDDQNLQFAYRLHRSMVHATGGQDRGIRRARFMGVIRTQNRPAILLEAGYLSNHEDAVRIAQPAYRQRLAEAVASALALEIAPLATARPRRSGTDVQ
jgi:N-acetylmuramoyl-L-alanine amidase